MSVMTPFLYSRSQHSDPNLGPKRKSPLSTQVRELIPLPEDTHMYTVLNNSTYEIYTYLIKYIQYEVIFRKIISF